MRQYLPGLGNRLGMEEDCTMARRVYPEFHKSLMEKEAWPSATRRVKFEETHVSYLYRTGEFLYKIRKNSALYDNLPIKERYIQLSLQLGKIWAPEMTHAVLPVVRTPAGFSVGGAGEVVDYALQMTQLTGTYWLNHLAGKKIGPVAVGRLARFIADCQAARGNEGIGGEYARVDYFRALVEETAYQARKYVGQTLSETMLDVIHLPMNRFYEEARKLFQRRHKRGRVVHGHGNLTPEHIYMKGSSIAAFAPLDALGKFREIDAAYDVAALTNGLKLQGAGDINELLVKRYITAAKDRDLPKVLPAFQVLNALRMGQVFSEWLVETPEEQEETRKEYREKASAYYGLAVQASKEIPREI